MTYIETKQRAVELTDTSPKSLLIRGCCNSIEQCNQILQLVSKANYVDGSSGSSSIGTHIRHILDRYHCFFAGLTDAAIDYDARKRDPQIEQNPEAAMFALESVARRVERLQQLPFCNERIAVKESVLSSSPAVDIASTLERELMGLITHSTHHLAIIALLAKSFGYQMDSDFGKAPSTIVYERY